MKTNKLKTMTTACIIAAGLLVSVQGHSQDRRLPDGTIIYRDGTTRLPNGTVVFKGGNIGNNGGNITLPDGSVVYPDGTRRYPNDRRYNGKRTNLPPGQAKKIYGGSAKDYAPGQQKKWKDHGNENGKGKGKWKKHDD